MSLLQGKGGQVIYHDPYCPIIKDDEHTPLKGLPWESVPLEEEVLRAADAVLIVTDHSNVDYEMVAREATLVVDTRGVLKSSEKGEREKGEGARGEKRGARIVGLSGQRQDR